MATIFSESFLNIMGSFIPSKFVTVNDKDAPWVTPEVKASLRRNKNIYKTWLKNGKDPETRDKVRDIQRDTNRIISRAKSTYINALSNKICDPDTGQKAFWTAFKRLSNNKKITNIPPLYENGRYISNFKDKADVFNNYFAEQCRPHVNSSFLP